MNIFFGALVANAAAMGFNWIYDMDYLEKLSKEHPLVFQPIKVSHYKSAKASYLAYPNAKVGSVSLQGEIAKWLYDALKLNPNLNASEYLNILKTQLSPGGTYQGYLESYGKKLIFNDLVDQLRLEVKPLSMDDEQLVGFIPYIVCKSLNIETSKAIELTNVLSNKEDYALFFNFFDILFKDLTKETIKEKIKSLIVDAPAHYKANLTHAINIEDTHVFIQSYSGTACHIRHALPLIFHIIYHSNSYEEAVTKNVMIGGASCDRGMLIGAIYSKIDHIPKNWLDLTLKQL